MKHINLFNIKLNHMQIFLTVAEYGSFTIAAEKLHLTQPFVSKSILHLEEELGLYLFIRGNRKFQITPAGRQLYQDWKALMQNFENSLTRAHTVQSGLNDRLKVGIGELSHENNIILQNLKKAKETLAGLDVVVEYDNMASLLEQLTKNELDIIVISGHMLPMIEGRDLAWQYLVESNLSVYIHRNNPLFFQENIEFKDLKREKFIVFSSKNDNSYINLLHRLAQEAGFTPMISCYVPNEISFRANLELGNGIVLADSFSNLESSDIKRFDLNQKNGIIAVWKSENFRESMRIFLSLFSSRS